GLEAALGLKLHEAVEHAMGCSSARKRLLRNLPNAPDLSYVASHALQIPFALDHAEIAERPFQNILDAGNAAAGQVSGYHRVAGVEANLQTEQYGAFGVRLHGAAKLAVDMTEEGSLPIGIEPEHAAEPGGGSEDSGR